MTRSARIVAAAWLLACMAFSGCAAPPLPTAAPTPSPPATPSPTETSRPTAASAGPPYSDPVFAQVVYDAAGVLGPPTEVSAHQIILGLEELIGAEIVVYTQVKPGATAASTERDAMALMDQWGIGGEDGDDGLVILFNLDEALCHGQVQLYAGPRFRSQYASNDDRQRIFEEDMRPLLRECDLDGAVLVALERIDELVRATGPAD